MEGWSRQADRNRDVLMRIVALLVALADLADGASGLSVLRRRHVLKILCHGEAEARAFIVGLMPTAPVQSDEPEMFGDAARLAARFRVLALVLYSMLRRGLAHPGAIRPRAGGRNIFARVVRGAAITPPDTS